MKRNIELSEQFHSRVAQWAVGEITWAEVEGFTGAKAQECRRVACDLAGRGQLKKAAGIFEALLAMNPKDHSSRSALGTVYQKMGRNEDAKAAYDLAIETHGRDVVALANRGELRVKGGDVAGGLDDLRRAVEADPSAHSVSARRAKALATAIIVQAAKAGEQRNP